MLKSHELLNEIKDRLANICDELDTVYANRNKELKSEILDCKAKKSEISKQAKELYNELSFEICEDIIKKSLPLRVRLFNKIHCNGYGITVNNTIEMRYYYNSNMDMIHSLELVVSKAKD